jgi:hypothetical protein
VKAQTLLAGVAIVVTLVLALQGWTFSYVVAIENRLTRLETLQGLEPRRPAALEPRLIVGHQALDDRAEQHFELFRRIERQAHEEAELVDCARALEALNARAPPASVVPHEPGGVEDRGDVVRGFGRHEEFDRARATRALLDRKGLSEAGARAVRHRTARTNPLTPERAPRARPATVSRGDD